MRNKNRNHSGKQKQRRVWIALMIAGAVLAGTAIYTLGIYQKHSGQMTPDQLLVSYMAHIPRGEYEEMYELLYSEEEDMISKEDFVTRNSSIYEGIELQNMSVEVTAYDEKEKLVTYQTSFDTVAGHISFENEAQFQKGKDGYRMVWSDTLIFPVLTAADKVRVSTTQAERGEILDRNGRVLAGEGTASSVGVVPGKMGDRSSTMEEIAELLEMDVKSIEKKLSAQWVKDDSFVPITTVRKVSELEWMTADPDEELLKEQVLQKQLLEIPGVMISDVSVRSYPLGAAAAHLVGYVQNVTAEDLEEHAGEGYTSNSVIGRSGMEALFETELKGQNGSRIYIVDEEGNEKAELASSHVRHGTDIQLTIDADLQEALYRQFQDDKGCSVAMNPDTGEVLALVSTPSYDNNGFILGMSQEQWTMLNEDENKPLYNRFRQTWCPGSSFKPVIAAIGLQSGAIDPAEDFGNAGLSWQKDASWGSYYVTTLHACEPANLENALIYSDNIYFAKAALRIGTESLQQELDQLGFGVELPFEIKMAQSQYSNTKQIETEIQLADSGYGQGQVLINPLHLACLYTAFYGEGSIRKPYLVYQEDAKGEDWISQAFPADVAAQVKEGLRQVVNDSNGTGYAAHREDVVLAGKTGTAEIKASKEDTSGTELGWFAVFTGEDAVSQPILIVSMAEDVKERGGSGYVVNKVKAVLDQWL